MFIVFVPTRLVYLFVLWRFLIHSPKHRLISLQKQTQRTWFLEESEKIDPIEKPFTPDGASDLGDIWRPRQAKTDGSTPSGSTSKTFAKPVSLLLYKRVVYLVRICRWLIDVWILK